MAARWSATRPTFISRERNSRSHSDATGASRLRVQKISHGGRSPTSGFAYSTNAGVTSCPFFATLIAILFTKSLKANKNIMAGGLTAIAGLALVVFNGKFILKLSPTGDMLAMAACLSWAVYSVVMRSVTERYDAVMVTRKIFGYGLMTGAPILLAKGWDCGWETLSKPVVAGNVVFLGLGPSFLCFLIWTKVIKEIGTVRATNYLYLNPVSTMVVSAIVLGEVVTPLAFIGAGLILAGIYISMKKPKENA